MGHEAAFSCIAGALFGWILQRTRFCFLCNFRDFFERREPHGVLTMVETVPFVSSIVEQIYICAIRRTTRRLAEAFPILHDLIAGYRSLLPQMRQDARRGSQFAGIDVVSLAPR